MSTYRICEKSVTDLASGLIDEHYPDVEEAKATIRYLFAYGPRDEDGHATGPAITHNGYVASGLCRVNSLRDRVAGLMDVTILLNGDEWPDWSSERQLAVLDHEIYHVQVQRDKSGRVKIDEAGRPKIRLRKHDIVIGGFHAIIERHGLDAIEAASLQRCGKKHQPLLFPELEEANA